MHERGYAIKVTMYLGHDGVPVKELKDAELIKDFELAEAAALVAGGQWVDVVRKVRPAEKRLHKRKTAAKKHLSPKANQSWMRGGC